MQAIANGDESKFLTPINGKDNAEANESYFEYAAELSKEEYDATKVEEDKQK